MLIVHLSVSYAHVNLCHFFSSFWCRGLAAASACGSSWTFLFTFLLALIAEKTIFDLLGMLNPGERSFPFGRVVVYMYLSQT